MIPDGIEPLVEWLAEEYDWVARRQLPLSKRAEFRAALLTLVERAKAAYR